MEGEHMKPDFVAMNPQHNIPTVKVTLTRVVKFCFQNMFPIVHLSRMETS